MNTLSSSLQVMGHAVLVGNSFPLSLIRRPVRIEPIAIDALRAQLNERPAVSFWGHAVTVGHASALLGVDLTPETDRPALLLDAAGFPTLGEHVFRDCFVLSPEFVPGYRPAIGEEVPAARITGWHALHLFWE
jgi:hypothetical protein